MVSIRLRWFGVVVALATWMAPQVAWAEGWYIRWSCVGACEGYGGRNNGNTGIIGPFPNEDECERARHGDLPIPDDSLFPHHCEYIPDSPPSGTSSSPPASTPYTGASSSSAPPTEIEVSSIEFGLLAGPGWVASDDVGSTDGRGTVGFGMDIHTGAPFVGATFQLGVQGTRIEAPVLGEAPRTWFVAPASVGIALTPRLFTVGSKSLWLDLGASLVGFVGFGCDGCAAPVFSERFGYGGLLEAGLQLMLSEETGLGLDFVAPRYGIGTAAPGDLRLTSPRGALQLSVVGRFPS